MTVTWSVSGNLGDYAAYKARIAADAAAAEREACAKIANTISDKAYAIYKGRMASEDVRFSRGDPWADGYSDGAGDVAEQILARGGK